VTDQATIVIEIDAIVGANFDAWTIGLTHDPALLKRRWRDTHQADVSRWQQWQADSLDDARAIELRFTSNGAKTAAEPEPEVLSDDFPTYVCVF
jgi:hypothetical protein